MNDRYFAIRSIRKSDIFNCATSIKYNGEWYPVLGYDHTDGIMCLENHQGDDIVLNKRYIHHSEIRVEVDVKRLDEVLDKLN